MKYKEYGTEGEDDENRTKIKEHSAIQEILSLVFEMARDHIWMYRSILINCFNGTVVHRKGGRKSPNKS